MVYKIKTVYKLTSPDVLSSMMLIPREEFVPSDLKDMSYDDRAVSIGFGQTISQPYTVAFMTNLVISNAKKTADKKLGKILEVGTGSGYQAAILSRLAKEVYTVEIIPQLAIVAKKTLKKLGFNNVHVRVASGERGWKLHLPYDAIIVTAGIKDKVPEALFNQLKEGGVLVAPIGSDEDMVMTRFTKKRNGKFKKEEFGIFHFVPFVEEKD